MHKGCREALLLKGIPSVNDCAQYCDETVDQVFLEPEKYGYNMYLTPGNAEGCTSPKTELGKNIPIAVVLDLAPGKKFLVRAYEGYRFLCRRPDHLKLTIELYTKIYTLYRSGNMYTEIEII